MDMSREPRPPRSTSPLLRSTVISRMPAIAMDRCYGWGALNPPRSPDSPPSLPSRLHHGTLAPHSLHWCHRGPSRAGGSGRPAPPGGADRPLASQHTFPVTRVPERKGMGATPCTLFGAGCHIHTSGRYRAGKLKGGPRLAGRDGLSPAGHRRGPPGSHRPSSRRPGLVRVGVSRAGWCWRGGAGGVGAGGRCGGPAPGGIIGSASGWRRRLRAGPARPGPGGRCAGRRLRRARRWRPGR